MNPLKLGVGVILVVVGALLMADSVITVVNSTHVFFPDVQPAFEFIVGLIALVVFVHCWVKIFFAFIFYISSHLKWRTRWWNREPKNAIKFATTLNGVTLVDCECHLGSGLVILFLRMVVSCRLGSSSIFLYWGNSTHEYLFYLGRLHQASKTNLTFVFFLLHEFGQEAMEKYRECAHEALSLFSLFVLSRLSLQMPE